MPVRVLIHSIGRVVVTATSVGLALAACSASSTTSRGPALPVSPAAIAHTPGMVMPDGSTMGATAAPTGGPSPAALMVCSDDVRGHIQQALRLPSAPTGTGVWSGDIYTCTYRLPGGALVLSVREAKDRATTSRNLAAVKASTHATDNLIGLTPDASGDTDGIVVLSKDNDVLTVNASGLPEEFGPEQSHRPDFAYEIASDVLGCWTGDGE